MKDVYYVEDFLPRIRFIPPEKLDEVKTQTLTLVKISPEEASKKAKLQKFIDENFYSEPDWDLRHYNELRIVTELPGNEEAKKVLQEMEEYEGEILAKIFRMMSVDLNSHFKCIVQGNHYRRGQIFDKIPNTGISTSESLEAQINRLFPASDHDCIERILGRLTVPLSEIAKVTDKTGSEAVVSFDVYEARQKSRIGALRRKRKVFCTVSNDIWSLTKAANYIEQRRQFPILRPITSELVGLVGTERSAALLTYDTNELALMRREDMDYETRAGFDLYLSLREASINHLARVTNSDADELKEDVVMINVFNAALEHV